MLVCPNCQFDNPDSGKFCQNCGLSLTERVCPVCESANLLNVENCSHCGAVVGTTWQAIVSRSLLAQGSASAAVQQSTQAEVANSLKSLPVGAYLDIQQRYRLLAPLPASSMATDVEVRVLDCQPFQLSPLEVLLGYPLDEESIEAEDSTATAAESDSIQAIDLIGQSESAVKTAISPIAQIYLTLQEQLYPSLPLIHDAWERDGQTVVLLEDRTHLPLLMDLWSDPNVLPIQVLHWLHEMTELWAVLQIQHCCQSLLELNNLRVDEDQLLCLQRLYLEKPEGPLELKDLGRVWLLLFQQSQRTQLGSLAQLCQDLEVGNISALNELRSRLEAIANELQPDDHTPDLTPKAMPELPIDPANSDATPSTAVETSQAAASNLNPNAVGVTDLSMNPAIPSSAADLSDSDSPTRLELGVPDEEIPGDSDDVPTVVLPMKLMSLEDAGRTDIGRQRDHNEDYFSVQTETEKLESPTGRTLHARGLYILCDGMGGHAGGEVASALAVDTLRQYFAENWRDNQLPNEEAIRAGIHQANKAIYDLNQQNARSGSGRMGTTLVLVLIQDTEAAIAHVGDSRLYRFSRRRGLEQVTVDHEVGQREIQRGVDPAIAYARPDAYQLTQALGPRDENFISPDVEFIELNEDLLLILCSDGMTDNDLLETHWRTHLDPLLNTQTNLELGVQQLIELANQYNGHDNITVVTIRAKVRPNLEQLKS
ncbi:serine/threonine phosphatase [Oculatella sp. FACHB-28]|uniref:serine/threonine phosphatase n=1 Tax=Oculatella sp. FACHB-28 TaxID=2692845 RepID=UPI001688E9A8|nr:serine/threonine phosphatase [Oculatella sp. FACHB-28]MBD2057759.1 serine/threonine phosphatase [Oculatella sp. FACHB-28]